MVKAYLRYEFERAFGVICGARCGAVVVKCGAELREKYGARAIPAACAAGDAVVLWDLRTGQELSRFSDAGTREAGEVASLAVIASGSRLAAGYADGSVRVWSLLSGALDGVFTGHVTWVTALCWAQEGDASSVLISGSADGEIAAWDPDGQKGRFRLHAAHSNEVTALLVRSGHILSASKDGLVKVFSIDLQVCVQVVTGHAGEVWCMDAAGQFVVTGSIDQEIRVWKLADDPEAGELGLSPLGSVRREGSSRCVAVRFNRGGSMLLAHGTDKGVQLFHVRNEAEAKRHRRRRLKRRESKAPAGEAAPAGEDEGAAPGGPPVEFEAADFFHHARSIRADYRVRSASFLDVGRKLKIMVHMHHNLLEVLEVGLGAGAAATMESVMKVDAPGHRGDVRALALTGDDSSLLSLSSAKTLKVWSPATGACLRTIATLGYGLCCGLIRSDQFVVAAFKSGELQIFDFAAGDEVFRDEAAHEGAVWGIDVLPGGDDFATCGSDRRIKLWRTSLKADGSLSVKVDRVLEVAEDVLGVRVTPDGRLLLAALLDSTVRSFHLDTLRPSLTFYGHKMPVLALDVTSDSTMLATGSADKNVKLWGLDFGDCRRNLRAHEAAVTCVAFQPDTHYLFTGSRDGKFKYWDADRFEMVTELDGQRGEVWACKPGLDGEMVATGSHDRSIRVWRRTDEMMFVEEEKNRRLDKMLESNLLEDEGDRRAAAPIVQEEVTAEASLAGRRTLNAVNGAEALIEALKLAGEEQDRRNEETDEPPSVELLGLSAEQFVLRALKRLRRADLEATLQLVPLKETFDLLAFCVSWLQADSSAYTEVELIHRTVMYAVHSYQRQIIGRGDRSLMENLSNLLHARIERHEDNLGFNLAALEYLKSELDALGDDGFGLQPPPPPKRPKVGGGVS